MDKDLVTVGIPTRSTRPMIYDAIHSILNQTYKNFEILICDNSGEPDNPRITKIKKDFKDLNNFRVVHHEKDLGIGAARRTLVDKASGKYICFLSADDIYLPKYIETMLKEAKKHPDAILYSNYDVINENSTYLRTFSADTYDCYEDWLMSIIFKAHDDTMSVNYNIFAPTKILKKNNFDESLRFGEDLEHLLRCVFIEKVKYHHVPKVLFQYRIHPDSVTSKKMDDIKANNKRIFDTVNLKLGRQII